MSFKCLISLAGLCLLGACTDPATLCLPSSRADTSAFVGNIWRPETNSDAIFPVLWNQLTPENAGKWGELERLRDSMSWSLLDQAYAYSRDRNYPFKLHTLVWGANQPRWLAGLPEAEQILELTEWFDALAIRFPGVAQIDVVNEPLHAPPVYKNALGGNGMTGWDWVVNTFALARDRFPDSELLLNDFNILSSRSNTERYLDIIRLLIDRNLIDAIGVQGHFLEDANTAVISSNLDLLADTGLPIYVTEFDLNIADDHVQRVRYQDIFSVIHEHPSVQGITLWGYRENELWQENAYLLREDGTERPALTWLRCYLER